MSDMLANGAAWLAGQRRRFVASTVRYTRSPLSRDVRATIGRTVFELDNGSGMITQVESRDFIIAATDLNLSGSALTVPQSGDRIEDAAGLVYEVMPFGTEPVWRWVDGHRIDRRIHTKQIDTNVT